MLHAGNAIDATLGVTFGLSTLAAAACGQPLGGIGGRRVLFSVLFFGDKAFWGLFFGDGINITI